MTDTDVAAGGPAQAPISLKDIGGASSAAVGPQVVSATGVQANYDPGPEQERARAIIAYILLGVLVLSVLVMLIAGVVLAADCYMAKSCTNAKDSMTVMTSSVGLIFTPIVGLVGSVIGFYFGAKAAKG
ncbi:MAG TPA: hypothetical protein VGG29_14855 [Caulobacteraceae bacterium]|jgi:hypothetical protein